MKKRASAARLLRGVGRTHDRGLVDLHIGIRVLSSTPSKIIHGRLSLLPVNFRSVARSVE
jgi:hypothetical protein